MVTDTLDPADLIPIEGGYCVRRLGDGRCVDVMRMLYNWRVVLTHRNPDTGEHVWYEKGYCYFGHGTDSDGNIRSMESAFLAATAAAAVWDGQGDPVGFDKEVGTG